MSPCQSHFASPFILVDVQCSGLIGDVPAEPATWPTPAARPSAAARSPSRAVRSPSGSPQRRGRRCSPRTRTIPLAIRRTAAWSITGTIAGTANTQTMPGSVALNNGTMTGNTFATYGTFLVASGTTTITATGASNTINAGNIGLGGTLNLLTPSATDSLAISSLLGSTSASSGGLSKNGSGLVTLTVATDTYTGVTAINGGTLAIYGGSLAAGTPVTVNANGTLNLTRTATGFANRTNIAGNAISGSGVINVTMRAAGSAAAGSS